MAHKRVTLKRNGSLPTITLRFGQQLFAKYDIYLYDRDGGNAQSIATNETNSDNKSDTFTVGNSLDDLHQRILYWQAAISVLDERPNQTYVMTAIISQNEHEVGSFEKHGPITNTVIDQDTVRFILE
jgi:hypothetical protein